MVNEKANAALNRLASLPGMLDVKQQVEQMIQFSKVSQMRARQGFKSAPQSNHMLFLGNPGTGKTTAGRLIGEAFAAMGLLKTQDTVPRFVEVHHADVTHPHVGEAERTMKKKFESARGGVLFVDEAYAFVAGKTDHRTDDKVLATMVQLMEDMRDEIVVIAAGYPEEMTEFVSKNPGLRSRFPSTIHFPDYSVPDLVLVAKQMLADQEYQAAPDYLEALTSVLWVEKAKPHFGNARTVRNHVERSIRRHAVRVSKLPRPTRDDLATLRGEDLVHDARAVKSVERESLIKTIQSAQTRLMEIDLQEILQRR